MSPETGTPSPENTNLQFDKAEFDASQPSALTCQACKKTIQGEYFEINGKVFCAPCKEAVQKVLTGGSRTKRVFLATSAGSAAALLGTAIYYGIEKLTGYEFGFIAIVVGFMVGAAVRWGARGRGGWGYQLLAVFLTYNAIVMTYIPAIVEYYRDNVKKPAAVATPAAVPTPLPQAASNPQSQAAPLPNSTPVNAVPPASSSPASQSLANSEKPKEEKITLGKALLGIGALFLLAYMLPFLAGIKNIIGLVIIAFGLYEAWKLNSKPRLVINGPFQSGPPKV